MRVFLCLVLCLCLVGCSDPIGVIPGSTVTRTPDGYGELHTYTVGSMTGQIVAVEDGMARVRMSPWWTLEAATSAGFKVGVFVDVGRRGETYFVIEEVSSQTGISD